MEGKEEIFVFSQNFTPSSLGDAVRLTSVVEYFNACDYKVCLFTQTTGAKILESDLLKINILKWTTPKNSDRNLIRLVKEVILGFEIFFKVLFLENKSYYFFTSPPFISSTIGLLATSFKKGKLIFDVRDIYPDIYVKQGLIANEGFIHRMLTKIETSVYNRSSVVLAATQGLFDTIKSRTTSRCILFRNGYSKFFSPSVMKNEKFSIVFHGSLSKFQNIALLIDIIKDVYSLTPDIHFFVIGSGPKEQLFKENLLPNLTFLGRKPNNETAEIVGKCHLGISLRDDSQISIDAFPVKLYEYIGSGIPSIATPICEGGEILSKLEIGYNIPNNKEDIIELIMTLYNDRSLYETIVNNVISNREGFSREKMAKDVLSKVLNG